MQTNFQYGPGPVGRQPSPTVRASHRPIAPQVAALDPVEPPTDAEKSVVRRTGVVGWWLNLTAPAWPDRTLSIEERERLRKAELTSFSILAVFLLLVSLVSNSLAHPSTAQAVVVMAVGLVIAAILNRKGYTRTAAYLVPTLLSLVIVLAIVRSQGGLQLALLPAYDLLALPVFLISLIGHRRAPWIFAAASIAFILLDFALQPHAYITATGATNFDDITYAVGQVTWWGEVNRHVALVLFAALFGWLGARSVEAALARADQAEEVAALEHTVADQKRQLDEGVQQLLQTHIRFANGDLTARAPTNKDNMLWLVSASLNNLLARQQKSGQFEHELRRTEGELRHLAAALDDLQSGRRPSWPVPAGTAADLILARVARTTTAPPAAPHPATQTLSDTFGSGPLGPVPQAFRPAPDASWEPNVGTPHQSFRDAARAQEFGVPPVPTWNRSSVAGTSAQAGDREAAMGGAPTRANPHTRVPDPPWMPPLASEQRW